MRSSPASAAGSNAIGIFADFIDDEEVELIGVEAAGKGLDGHEHGATLLRGRPGILHGAETLLLQDEDGQVDDTWSISAGLDYPAVGPEHAHLQDIGRAQYVGIEDQAALDAFVALARSEGIVAAFESCHALAHALKLAEERDDEPMLLVNLSGRGDKDMAQAAATAGSFGRMTRYAAMFDRCAAARGGGVRRLPHARRSRSASQRRPTSTRWSAAGPT